MSDPIARLIQVLGKLPGIGEKTATRLAFHVLRAPESYARELAAALLAVKERIQLCSVCMNLTETDPCALCQDVRRDPKVLCVVAHPTDLMAIERTGGFRGRYHVLHGVLSPLDGVGPSDLRVRELLARVGGGGTEGGPTEVTEIILATSPNVEGEATALYLARLLKPLGLRVTRIASGVPIGGELEYADGITISRALEGRREM
ncbi:MAG TPA: recombination mediator RecR [Polyangia bacterium]|jgi:recombination protein RecR|nr:recombination mediator RecR [Polyangia bacterium]